MQVHNWRLAKCVGWLVTNNTIHHFIVVSCMYCITILQEPSSYGTCTSSKLAELAKETYEEYEVGS